VSRSSRCDRVDATQAMCGLVAADPDGESKLGRRVSRLARPTMRASNKGLVLGPLGRKSHARASRAN
jgi:hypothetical protein